MRRLLVFLFLLAACRQSEPSPAQSVAARSPCASRLFEGSRFTVCSEKGGDVEVRTSDQSGLPYRSFAALQAALGSKAQRVAFAMNGGMFGEDGNAIGLLVEDGKQLRAINRRDGGGNFHLKPNGVFLVSRTGEAAVVPSAAFKPSKDVRYATQSGPMLVINGQLHPKIDVDGRSRYIRNGVGIAPDGTPLFVISEVPVSFGKLARMFRDALHAKDALYLDGSVSSLWDPANARQDSFTPIGPIVVVFRRET